MLAVIFGIAFGVALVTTGMVTPGRTAATAVLLTAVLAGISVILVFRWEGVKDSFETRFEVRPPPWRLRRARASQTTAVVQFIVGAELRKRAEALEQALRQKRKAELECGEAAEEIKWPPLRNDESAKVEKMATALLKFCKARKELTDAESSYNKRAKLARRFGLRVCKSYRDYLPHRELPAELVHRIPL